jgi:hypothetical protein
MIRYPGTAVKAKETIINEAGRPGAGGGDRCKIARTALLRFDIVDLMNPAAEGR